MAGRINRAIELLAQGQAIYYVGGHSGHVLSRAQGRKGAGIWADYINVGMEHGSFDMAGFAEYMQGFAEAFATPVAACEPEIGSTPSTLRAGT
jgi:4-hydroxy-2-oxoheptanedioate aldolase